MAEAVDDWLTGKSAPKSDVPADTKPPPASADPRDKFLTGNVAVPSDFAAGRVKLPDWVTGPAPPPLAPATPPPNALQPPAVSPVDFYGNQISGEQLPAPIARVGQAAADAYTNSSDLLTPWARGALANTATGRAIYLPALDAVGAGWGAVNALAGGLTQGAYEAGSAVGGPSGGRDAATLLQVLPMAQDARVPVKIPPEMTPPYGFQDITTPIPPGVVRSAPEGIGADRTTGPMDRIPPDMPTSAPTTAAAANQAERARYGAVDRSSDVAPAKEVDRVVDNAITPQGLKEEGRQEFGKDAVVQKTIDNLQGIKGKDLPVQKWQGYDQTITDDIQTELAAGHEAAARQLQIIQGRMRDGIENLHPDDLASGDGDGFSNLGLARQASTQRHKMEVVEKIRNIAMDRKVPQTSAQTQITSLINNEVKTRSWSDDEIAELRKANETGQFDGVLHVLGSKLGVSAAGLLPAAAEALYSHGAPSAAAMAVFPTLYGISAGARGLENTILKSRMQNALDVLGQKVPINPLNYPPQTPFP